MLAIDLNNNNITPLNLEDTVARGLQLAIDFKLTHVPVIADEKFVGLISEKDLLHVHNKNMLIELMQQHLITASINENDHFLQALNICNQFQTNIVPVINFEKEFIGTISSQVLLKTLGSFTGIQEMGGVIVLEMERFQFSISEISRIVESNESAILQLNTAIQPETGLLRVTIHINKREVSAIIAAFERYEYDVVYFFGEQKFESDIHSNYRHLMNYLDI